MSVVDLARMEALAEHVAREAHGTDKNPHDGELYIKHVERVVAKLKRHGACVDVVVVAWLHDVVEDTRTTISDLRQMYFPEHILVAVDAITHRRGEPREDYYHRVGRNLLALNAKLSDMADNNDPRRRTRLEPATSIRLEAKYQKAWRCLRPYIDTWLEAT
jgi:(p)ppGpp synthase/HD superfamily hydrolase